MQWNFITIQLNMKINNLVFYNICFLLKIFLTTLVMLPQTACAQKSWSLEKCIDYAIKNNNQIQDNKLNIDRNDIQLKQKKAMFFPSLSAGSNGTINDGRSIDITTNDYINSKNTTANINANLNLNIFKGFEQHHSLHKLQYSLLSSKYSFMNSKIDVVVNVMNTYLQIVQVEEREDLIESQIKISEKKLIDSKKKVELGELTEFEIIEFEKQLLSEQQRHIELQSQKNSLYYSLYGLLGIDIDEGFIVEHKDVDADIKMEISNHISDTSKALENHPFIKSKIFDLKSSEYSISVAKSGRMPSLSFFAGASSNYSDNSQRNVGTITNPVMERISFNEQIENNINFNYGISLSIPIFSQYQLKSSIKQAEIDYVSKEIALDGAKRKLKEDISGARKKLEILQKKYFLLKKKLVLVKKNFAYISDKLDNGLITPMEYSIAKNELFDTESELLQIQLEHNIIIKTLEMYLLNKVY